jgi:hypothetical protein
MEYLDVSAEIKELFQYIQRYKPHHLELESSLKCFLPDYTPSIGQTDAFLKVPRPDDGSPSSQCPARTACQLTSTPPRGMSAELGLKVLDFEPNTKVHELAVTAEAEDAGLHVAEVIAGAEVASVEVPAPHTSGGWLDTTRYRAQVAALVGGSL